MANNSDLKPETSLSPAALTVDLDGTSVWNAMSGDAEPSQLQLSQGNSELMREYGTLLIF